MKRSLVLVTLVLVVGSQDVRAFDATAEEAKLLARDAEWADLARAGKDVDKIVSYWTEDAVLIFPGQPVVEGRVAIRAYVASCVSSPVFKIHWKSSKATFSPDGKMAYMPAATEMTVPGPNGALQMKLRAMTIWRVDADGQWRCVVDIANEEPAKQ